MLVASCSTAWTPFQTSVCEDCSHTREQWYFFEPSLELGRKGVLLSEAAVEPDADNCVVVVLENHRCEPVEVEEGQVLGRLHEAKLWVDTAEGIITACHRPKSGQNYMMQLLDLSCVTGLVLISNCQPA